MASTRRKYERADIKFTDKEDRLLAILLQARGNAVSTRDLVKAYFPADEPPPLNAQKVIVGRMRGIIAKAERMPGLNFSIVKTARNGPHPISYSTVKA